MSKRRTPIAWAGFIAIVLLVASAPASAGTAAPSPVTVTAGLVQVAIDWWNGAASGPAVESAADAADAATSATPAGERVTPPEGAGQTAPDVPSRPAGRGGGLGDGPSGPWPAR